MPAWWEAAQEAVAASAANVKAEAAVTGAAAATAWRSPCPAIIDVDDVSEDEAPPGGASAAVLQAVDAARTLLAVNTNSGGGGPRFRSLSDALRDLVAATGGEVGAGRARALALLDAMGANYVGKAPGSWRPFVVCAVRALGAGGEAVASAQRLAKVRPDSLEAAERITDERLAACAAGPQIRTGAAGPQLSAAPQIVAFAGGAAQRDASRGSLPGRLSQTPSPRHPPRINVAAAAALADTVETPSPAAILPTAVVSPPGASKGYRGAGKRASAAAVASSSPSDGVARGLDRFFVCAAQPPQAQPPQALGVEAAGAEDPPPRRRSSAGRPSASSSHAGPSSRPADAAGGGGDSLASHRAVLRLSASGGDGASLRSAYRRRALETHPDKGGSDADFRAVQAAFEALSKAERPSEAEVEEEGGSNDLAAASARCVCSMLRQAPASAWERLLAALDAPTLQALDALLEGQRDSKAAAASRSRASSGAVALNEPVVASQSFSAGITKSGTGYAVTVGWRSFRAKSGVVRTLEQAVNLHVMLVQLRNAALLRHEAHLRDLEVLRVEERGAGAEECPAILESELSRLRLEEPLAPIFFASDHTSSRRRTGVPSKRIMSPFTPCVASALRFRKLILGVLATEDENGPVQQRLDRVTVRTAEVKRLMQEQAALDKASAAALDRDFGEAVARVLRRREASSSPASAVVPACSQIVPVGSSNTQLALAEAAFEPVAELAAAHREAVALLSADAVRRDEANRVELEKLRADCRSSVDERRRADALQASLDAALKGELDAQRATGDARRQVMEEMQKRSATQETNQLLEEQLQQLKVEFKAVSEARNDLLRAGAGTKRPLTQANSAVDAWGPAQRPRYTVGVRRMESALG